jgi:quinol monooxygenase YgiN
MYGTVARFRVKPGMEEALKRFAEKEDRIQIPGAVATYVFRMDSSPDEYYMTVIFTDKKAYFDNARSPDQDTRYREFRALLESDPEWHDGEIVHGPSPQTGLRL